MLTNARREADCAIAELAATGKPFSTNDMRHRLSVEAMDRVSLRLDAAARRGEIERIGTVVSTSPQAKGRRTALWRGTTARAALPDRNSLAAKAVRHLTAGAVTVLRVADGEVDATVRGEVQVHQITCHDGRWYCGCNRDDAADCSHVVAVAMVTRP